MPDKDQCCGICTYRNFASGEWCCDNEDSEAYGLSVDYSDYCDEYKEREDD